jgi:hypothetical protein
MCMEYLISAGKSLQNSAWGQSRRLPHCRSERREQARKIWPVLQLRTSRQRNKTTLCDVQSTGQNRPSGFGFGAYATSEFVLFDSEGPFAGDVINCYNEGPPPYREPNPLDRITSRTFKSVRGGRDFSNGGISVSRDIYVGGNPPSFVVV